MSILHPPKTLTPAQKRMYDLESEENFRWLASSLGTTSSHVLTPTVLVPDTLKAFLATIGQFAEAANGMVDPAFIWANKTALLQKDFPLEGYDALQDSELLKVIKGDVANLQAIVTYRRQAKQLVVGLSGTCNFYQLMHFLWVFFTSYPWDVEKKTDRDRKASRDCKVHAGFYRMLQGLLPQIGEQLSKSFESRDTEIDTLVLTGHSLGGALAILLAMEILQTALVDGRASPVRIPPGLNIKVVVFGCPRAGNHGLFALHQRLTADYRERFGGDKYEVHSVKGYNDGVPCLLPYSVGYRHLVPEPLYLFHNNLYKVPAAEMEHSFFPVEVNSDEPIAFPKGGHNYYNGRDMAKGLRRLLCINHVKKGWDGWEDRYLEALKKGKI